VIPRSSVLYLVPDLIGLPGGIARYCRHVCRALNDAGERTTVVALRDAPDSDPSGEGIEVSQYIACGTSKTAFVRRATSAAMSNRPRLILCGHPNFSPLAYLLSRMLGVPFVVFLYGTDSWHRLHGARGWAIERADRWIAISAHTARLASTQNNLDHERIDILHNCLDPDFQFTETDMSERKESLLTVSRITNFEPHKGQELVLAAMPRLLEQFPQLTYDIVGDGDRRPALERLAADLGVNDSVRFHGVVTDSELSALYSKDAVFVMPSTVEGFGFVFAEAMAHGMPAIGGNRDAGAEVIINRRTGFVIDPESVGELGTAVADLLGDEELWRRMSEEARRHARSSFSYALFRERFATIFARTINTEVQEAPR
jgi:phosphatidyl-myo-inositol dimannoside synthase